MHTHLDLEDLQILSEALVAVHPEQECEEGLPEAMDPLLDKILNQAHAQIESAAYCLDLTDDEVSRIQSILQDALDEAMEDGDLFVIGRLQEILGKFVGG